MYMRMHNELATKLGSQINTVYSFLVLELMIVHAPSGSTVVLPI